MGGLQTVKRGSEKGVGSFELWKILEDVEAARAPDPFFGAKPVKREESGPLDSEQSAWPL